jgi:hypothetical protein
MGSLLVLYARGKVWLIDLNRLPCLNESEDKVVNGLSCVVNGKECISSSRGRVNPRCSYSSIRIHMDGYCMKAAIHDVNAQS